MLRAGAVAVLVLLPWVGWNVWAHGAPHLLTATAGRNLHQGLFISRRVGWTTPVGELNREADWALWNDLRQARVAWTGDVTVDDAAAGRVAREWIGQHPRVATRLWARNLLLTWYLARTATSMVLHAVVHGILLLLALAGAVRGGTWRQWRARVLLSAMPTGALWLAELAGLGDPGTPLRLAVALPTGAVTALWLAAVSRGDLR
jgi:hypothetical protein